MDQHPTRQIPDDELVEIADEPQLWISKDGYVKTLRLDWCARRISQAKDARPIHWKARAVSG